MDFTQAFSSPSYSDRVVKRLDFERVGNAMENIERAGIIRPMKPVFLILFWLMPACLIANEPPGNEYEQSLLETIKEIQSQNHEQALNSTLAI